MNAETQRIPLTGWDIARGSDAEWIAWGGTGDARAKVLSSADGYTMVVVEARAGYRGTDHTHAYPEFLYVLHGELRNQGQRMQAGDGYAASTGSEHTDFETEHGATYLLVFRI
jgi:quercetin dioxygenase-like cupin family protein